MRREFITDEELNAKIRHEGVEALARARAGTLEVALAEALLRWRLLLSVIATGHGGAWRCPPRWLAVRPSPAGRSVVVGGIAVRREIAGFLDSARRRGLGMTLRMLASDIGFDASYGVETRGVLEGLQLGVPAGGVDGDSAVYHAVNPIVLALALAQLRALAPAALSSGSFVDFGSGKGRALVLAAREGFPRVVGIENSPVLHELCVRNLRKVWRNRGLSCGYELHLGDAAAFRVPDDSSVWFWFNPFDAALAHRVASNLAASLLRRPRTAYLVYARPLHVAVLQELGFIAVAEVRTSPTHLDALVFSHPNYMTPSNS